MKQWHSVGLLLALAVTGVAAFIIWKTMQASDFQEQTIYVQNIPYVFFLGHVVKTDEELRLMKNFPLYDDDPRDGIWTARCIPSPMEKINFRARKGSQDRHGIMLYTYERKWIVIWFEFANASWRHGTRTKWDLVTGNLVDFLRQRPSDWGRANGEMDVLSREEIQNLGIQDLINCQNSVAETDEHNREAIRRYFEERAAKAEVEKEPTIKGPAEP